MKSSNILASADPWKSQREQPHPAHIQAVVICYCWPLWNRATWLSIQPLTNLSFSGLPVYHIPTPPRKPNDMKLREVVNVSVPQVCISFLCGLQSHLQWLPIRANAWLIVNIETQTSNLFHKKSIVSSRYRSCLLGSSRRERLAWWEEWFVGGRHHWEVFERFRRVVGWSGCWLLNTCCSQHPQQSGM